MESRTARTIENSIRPRSRFAEPRRREPVRKRPRTAHNGPSVHACFILPGRGPRSERALSGITERHENPRRRSARSGPKRHASGVRRHGRAQARPRIPGSPPAPLSRRARGDLWCKSVSSTCTTLSSGQLQSNLFQPPKRGKRFGAPRLLRGVFFPYGKSGDVGNRIVGQRQAGVPGPTRGTEERTAE